MNPKTIIRGVTLLALLAGAAPAPASAQLSGFLKKQIKQKIIHTVVDSAMSKLGGPSADSGQATATTPDVPRAGAGARGAVAQGPHFDEYVVEMTPRSLDRLEKYLTTLRADAGSGKAPKLTSLFGGGTDGLSMVQLGLMAQRAVAFCAMGQAAGSGSAAAGLLPALGGLQESYAPAEIAALRPRCAHLTKLMGGQS